MHVCTRPYKEFQAQFYLCTMWFVRLLYFFVLPFQVIGTLVVTSTCEEGPLNVWPSQPKKRHFAAGNVELAVAILFTGSSPSQSIRLLQSAGIPCFTARTYFRLQLDILHPPVKTVITHLKKHHWENLRRAIVSKTQQHVCRSIRTWCASSS